MEWSSGYLSSISWIKYIQQKVNQQGVDHACALYWLAVTSAKKLAKDMLKDRSSNLILWNGYAQMEKSHGRLKEVHFLGWLCSTGQMADLGFFFFFWQARRVYQTALASYRQFPESDQQSAPLLYSAFAQLEWEEKRPEEALKILVSMATEEPYGKCVIAFCHGIRKEQVD